MKGTHAMPKPMQAAAASQRSALALWPVMDTLLGMHTLMASSYERVIEFQHDALSVATAEIAAYQSEWLRAIGAAAQLSWPHVHAHNAGRIVDVTRAWFEFTAQTPAAMARVLRESVLDPGQAMVRLSGQETAAFVERRSQSVVINFPDRRAA